MLQRLVNRLKFELERFVVRSPFHRLLFIALLIGVVSVGAGLLARHTGASFDSAGDAIWWAFLRLTDPGYLGDDQGAALRLISTVVTVLGYVIFLGALIAIMTQWLNATMQRLESGLTPLAANHHVLILGYTSRTAAIVKELLVSEARVERFLQAHKAARLKVVILAEEVGAGTVQDLRDKLGPLWRPRQIVFRSGTPLRIEHLHRVDFLHASAILLPAFDVAGEQASAPDARTIKALRATSSSTRAMHAERLPLVVAEITDQRRVAIAERAYGGPIEILASDALVARLVMQTVRHPGISIVYEELLAPASGNDVFVRRVPELDGKAFAVLPAYFREAIPLGVIRTVDETFDAILAPSPDFTVEPGDELVFVAKDFAACVPSESPIDEPPKAVRPSLAMPLRARPARRVLVLGWSQKVPALVRELAVDPAPGTPHQVDVFSSKPSAERATAMGEEPPPHVRVRQLEGDYTSPAELSRLDVGSYDSVVLVASDRVDSPYQSDARTILGHLVLGDVLARVERRPSVVVELMGQENVELLGETPSEVVVSQEIVSHMLTQVALRRELHAVYTDLFGAGGAELVLRSPAAYDLVDAVSFAEVREAACLRDEIALGILCGGALELAPARTRTWTLRSTDRVVVVGHAPRSDASRASTGASAKPIPSRRVSTIS